MLRKLGFAVALATGLLALSGCGSAKKPETLAGTVGPGFRITLTTADGQPVTTASPGRYAITVDDRSAFLNYHFFGPGVDSATSVPGKGTTTWEVNLSPGVYTYQCDPHASLMHGSLTVG